MNASRALGGRVDAHHHVWRLDRGDYGWLTPALKPIYRDFTLTDLRPLVAAADIGTTVLVQAAPTVAETEFLLKVAHASDGLVRAVVGWADLAAQDAVPTLTRLAQNALLKSIRPMLHDLRDPEWILRRDVDRTLSELPRLGLAFDALVRTAQLPSLTRMLDRHPDLRVVVDHGAKPEIATGMWEPWASGIAAVARHPLAMCKLSGLVTEARTDWTIDNLRRYVDHLLECFGPTRLLWGSDWPVVDLAGGYRIWVAATETLLAGLPPDDRNAIVGGNARAFYDLD
ncbi:MAG: amidohydrolase family protein [Betaproteobacteria bacterium]